MKRHLVMTLALLTITATASFPAAADGRRGGGGHGGYSGGHGGHSGRHGGYHGGHGGYYRSGGHSHSSFDFYFGGPLWYGPGPYMRSYGYGYPYPYPYYYEPRTVIIEREPPVYIQREPVVTAPAPAEAAPSVWYYCTDPAGYYPYVPNCNQQWVSVDPRSVAPGPPAPR